MSISNKNKIKKKTIKKGFIKRLSGIFMFIFGIFLLPLILVVLFFNKKTKLTFIEKISILIEAYTELLTGDYKSLKDRK